MRTERVLLVEDERIIAIDLQNRLERLGFQVLELATTGEEAISSAKQQRPDIVLMDVMLPGAVDGVAAAKTIGEDLGIPVIFLSAYSDEKTLNRAKSAGPFAYVVKPFTERELSTSIDLALHKHQMESELKRQERWLGAVLDSVADAIIATDMNNRIRFMNHAAEEITGWTEEEAKERPVTDVVKDHVDENLRFLELMPEGDNPFEESLIIENTQIRKKSGQPAQIEGTMSRIHNQDGNVDGQVLAFRDVTMVSRMSETIHYQASHDILTGLSNREHFSKKLDSLIADAKTSGHNHALLYLDIDQFKVINETCGHVAGDELLRHTTTVIRAVVRSSDVGARLGSDEFGVLLENISPERAAYIAERLRARLNHEKFVWEPKTFTISSSIGLVQINDQSKDIYSVLAAADDACYLAKELGGGRIQIYEDESSVFLRRRGEMEWISKIKSAIDDDRLRLYFQPIVPILDRSKRPKCEILVRMADPDGSVVMPADFLPAAERYNLMPAIDRWVISTTFESYTEIMSNGNKTMKDYLYCINLSGTSMADTDLLTYIRTEIERTSVPPESFCFEVTETAAIGNFKTATRFIAALKQIGCTFSLDDFGSGFSSFSYLKALPVDYLKIDGSFVKDMHQDPINRAMVEAINNLGKLMKVETIAEFVENVEIIDHLKQIGVDYAQGYEIGRPSPLIL